MVGANFTACTLTLAPGNSLTGFGHYPTDLKRDRAHLSIFIGAQYVWYCFCLWGVSSLSFLGGEEPPIIYVQDIHIVIIECVDGLCGCH